jgi:hypothetical protein
LGALSLALIPSRSGVIPEHWPKSESLIQTAFQRISFGLDFRDFALAETAKSKLDHRLRRGRVFLDAQQLGNRPACFVWVTSVSDGIQDPITVPDGQEEGIQNGEPLGGQLLFARRLMYPRHRQSLITVQGHSRTLAQASVMWHKPLKPAPLDA